MMINSVFANWKRRTFEKVMFGRKLRVVRVMPMYETKRVAKPITRQIPIIRNAHCEKVGSQIGARAVCSQLYSSPIDFLLN